MKGVEKVQEDLFATYLMTLGEEVYRFLRSKGATHEEAEDSIQNTMYKMYTLIETIEAEYVRPWFFRVALNDFIYETRKQARHNVSLTDAVTATYPDPSEPFDHIVKKEEIAYVLRDVKQEDQELLILKYYYDLTYDEIGQLLQMKPKTIKQKLYRVKKGLVQKESK